MQYPESSEFITDENVRTAAAYSLTDEFRSQFASICQMDTIPDISLGQMKVIKGDFIEKIVT